MPKRDAAEFGHVGAQAGGVDGAESGDRFDDGRAAGQLGVGGDACAHAAVVVGDRVAHAVDGRVGPAAQFGIEFVTELAERRELLDELAAKGEQVTEQHEVPRRGRGAFQAVEADEAGEHGGVDAVVLGEHPDGLGEAPGAQRIDEHGLEAGVAEALVQVAVKASGGLEDHAYDTVLEQPVAQGAAAHLGVVEAALVAAVEDVRVEVRLADIDAGDAEGGGGVHSCVPFLLQSGAVPMLPFRPRRNRGGGPTKLADGPGSPRATRSDPPPPVGPGQAPPAASPR